MTSFSTTCSRLSHYLKEQQRTAAAARPTTTMSLLPGLDIEPAETEDKASITVSDRKPMDLFPLHAGLESTPPVEEKAKLTISYGGQMLVFDNFPAEKAKADDDGREGCPSSTSCSCGSRNWISTTHEKGLSPKIHGEEKRKDP